MLHATHYLLARSNHLSQSRAIPWTHITFIVLVGLAAAFRCAGLARLDLGTDEAHSFLTVTAPQGILAQLKNDTNLPLYFVLLKTWTAIFGATLAAMRLLSAMFGIAAVAALALLARQCGASWRITLWATLLAALSPVQLHYAHLARGYTLSLLLITLGICSFVFAIQSRRPAAWAIHAILVVLGAWTHPLFIPIAAGYPMAAFLMRPNFRQWRAMTLAYAAAVALALPAILLAMHQAQFSGGTAWLRPYWLAIPPALAILKSLVLLALGGNMPPYLLSLPLNWPLQCLALVLTAFAAGAFFWPCRKTIHSHRRHAKTQPTQQWHRLLIIFTLWPLVFIWCYSALVTPIYLVGRYDIFAQPAYLLLLAIGFARLENAVHPFIAWILPAAVALVLAAGIAARRNFPLDPQLFHHEAQVRYLTSVIQPGDRILCTGLEAAPTLYWLYQFHMQTAVSTFPADTLAHPGWIISDEEILAHQGQWPARILNALNAAPPSPHRLWLLPDNAIWYPPGDFAPTPRQALSLQFISTALSHGWQLAETNPNRMTAESDLRIIALTRTPSNPPTAR